MPPDTSNAYFSGLLLLLRNLVSPIYSFHMPLFFMLSGAVLALRPLPTFDKCVVNKTVRLLFPYFTYGVLFMLPVKYLGNYYDREGLLLAFREFLVGKSSGHLWFLPALFWCTMIFLAVIIILRKLDVNSIYLVLLICGAIQAVNPQLPINLLRLQDSMGYLFWIALGYVFEVERKRHMPWSCRQLTLALVITIILGEFNYRYAFLSNFFAALNGSFFTYLLARVCCILFPQAKKTQLWKILVRNCFNIYLFHDPLEYVVLRISFHFNLLTSAVGCYFYAFARIVLVVVASILLGETISLLRRIANSALVNKKE